MKRRFLASILAMFLLVGVLAGCGNNEGSSSGTSSTSAASSTTAGDSSTEPATEQTLKVAAFQGGYGEDYWNEIVKLFEEKNEGVTVELTINPKLADIIRPQIMAGNAPDFIYLNDGQEDGLILSMIKDKALLEITDVFDSDNYAGSGTLRDDIKDGLLASQKCSPYGDGKIYLAPFCTGPTGMVYNKALFTEKGWDLPTTWDDFFTLGDTIKADDGRALFTYQGIYPGYLEEWLFPAIASVSGLDALTAIGSYQEGSFNNDAVLSALNEFVKIYSDGYLLAGTVGMDHTESQGAMLEGKAAFISNGTWMEGEMKDAPKEEGFSYGLTTFPVLKDGDTRYVLDSIDQFSIPVGASNPDLAKEFLTFLYGDESVKLLAEKAGGVYATKTARELAKEYISEDTYNMYGIYDEANVASMVMGFDSIPAGCEINIKDEIFNPISDVMTGSMTVQAWAEAVEDAMKTIREAQAAE